MNILTLRHLTRRVAHVAASATLVATGMVGAAAPAHATSDVEVFFSDADLLNVPKPNVLIILDTSDTMYTPMGDGEPAAPFDPAGTYDGACDPEYVYWTETGSIDCASSQRVRIALSSGTPSGVGNFECSAAYDLLFGGTSPAYRLTNYSDRFSQFRPRNATATTNSWQRGLAVVQGTSDYRSVCASDPADLLISGVNFPRNPSPYTLVWGKYQNYLENQVPASGQARYEVLYDAVADFARQTSGLNISLMRYGHVGSDEFDAGCNLIPPEEESNQSGNGGMVVLEFSELTGTDGPTYQRIVDLLYNDMTDDADSSTGCHKKKMSPGGRTPIAEVLTEAYAYYRGQTVVWGDEANGKIGSAFRLPSVLESRDADNSFPQPYDEYLSPILNACQRNYIIIVSDGTTEQDRSDNAIPGWVDANGQDFNDLIPETQGNQCDVDNEYDADGNLIWQIDSNDDTAPSVCVNDAAKFMFRGDMSDLPGVQNIKTYTIGLDLAGSDVELNATGILKKTARDGGGKYFPATRADELAEVLAAIAREVLIDNASFTSPSVAVNAFNRIQNLNDLYMAVFQPDTTYAWKGNVKKYRLTADGIIKGQAGGQFVDAVDPATGFFSDTSNDLWSPNTSADPDAADGENVAKGGAAARLPVYTSRNMYSNLTAPTLGTGSASVLITQDANRITELATDTATYPVATAAEILGITRTDGTGTVVVADVTVGDMVDWMRGKDVADEDRDSDFEDARNHLGDPLHVRPAVVIYGGDVITPAGMLFASTNDGVLHAFSIRGDSASPDGVEAWSFVPYDQLSRMGTIYNNPSTPFPENALDDSPAGRGYGLDGGLRTVRIDVDGDGAIDTNDGDKVYLYVAQRRGGTRYYALDVTTPSAPRLLWQIAASDPDFAGLGDSWSLPTPARVRTGTDTNGAPIITLMLVFGAGYDTAHDDTDGYLTTDARGLGLFMVNALTGEKYWTAGQVDAASRHLALDMDHAFAGGVRAVDISGDGVADRMYAADLGGNIWRVDLTVDADGNFESMGGRFADLGNSSHPYRFYFAPDVSILQARGSTFINVAIGGGHRERPNSDRTTENWFFSLRDLNVFANVPTDNYVNDAADCPVGEPCHETIGLTSDGLEDITNQLSATTAATQGWYIRLVGTEVVDNGDGTFSQTEFLEGEKVLAESQTFGGKIYFTTYTPPPAVIVNGVCTGSTGINKLYTLDAAFGRPAYDYNNDGQVNDLEDRSKQLAQSGIAPEVTFVFPSPDNPTQCVGRECRPDPICLVGLEDCGRDLINRPVRTYWQQRGVD